MTIPCQTVNNIKIYNVTGYNHHRLPDWMLRKHSKQLKNDSDFSQRVQLIQDFDFPEASLRLAMTRDQQHIVATGTYKPQIRVYELAESAMKFERHTDSENVAMQLLGDDWRKVVLLQSDRYVDFHSPSGVYHSTRIPKAGRDMIYDKNTCDMLFATSSPSLFRLNLDRGQFMAPFETAATAVNCVRISPFHSLYGLACDDSVVEFWDRRDRCKMGAIEISRSQDFSTNDSSSLDVTSLMFMPDGLHWVAGTSDGRVLFFDLRCANRPLDIRDHYNGDPIKKIDYHEATSSVISTDKRTVKFWQNDPSQINQRKLFTAIESDSDINDFILQQETGLVMVANDAPPISAYFIPSLGPAPRWCSFLENLTEEMEESAAGSNATVYENFKFVTKGELAQLSLDHLIGSNLLRAYMHGYFIDLRLYEKAKAIANPFAYEEYLLKRKAEKLEKERQSRIRAKDPVHKAKVNKQLAAKLVKDRNNEVDEMVEVEGYGDEQHPISKEKKQKKKAKETADALLADDRFAQLFADPDFEIDTQSDTFKLLHPSAMKSKKFNSRSK